MKELLVKLESVSKVYTTGQVKTLALREVSLEVKRGEFLAIAGPSGSGKTTLLNIIGTLDTPTKGKVFFEGVDLSSLRGKKLAQFRLNNLGFVFQSYNLIEVLTVIENVEFPLLLRGVKAAERRKRASAILERVGLSSHARKRPFQLSGGEQQRVAVARALVTDPKLVLADEPTANLDSSTGKKLIELMKQLNREKSVTFIFSTHDPMVMKEADRLIILRDGAIVEEKSSY